MHYSDVIDPYSRWMSEKMDGVRAYWNGEKMISRQGTVIPCPLWFISALPTNISFDGELWDGYTEPVT